MKKCLLGLTMLVCLAGTFRQGIFEFAHAVSHQFTGGHSYHSYHGNEHVTDHVHAILDNTRTASAVHHGSPISIDDKAERSFDKILNVFVPIALQTAPVTVENKGIPLYDLRLPASPFLQTATPPPDSAA